MPTSCSLHQYIQIQNKVIDAAGQDLVICPCSRSQENWANNNAAFIFCKWERGSASHQDK